MMLFNMFPHENRSKFFGPVRDVFYGWWMVGIVGFMITLMSITVFHGLGTLLVGLERHLFEVGLRCRAPLHLPQLEAPFWAQLEASW